VSLCHSFPTLFDLVDESETMEVDGVAKGDYWKVVDHCYLCDLCYMTKCPYVPPHEWNLYFPHLMLRAKAVRFKKQGAPFNQKVLTSTDTVGKLAGIPVTVGAVNALNRNKGFRGVLEKTLGVHKDAVVPQYHGKTLRKRVSPASGEGAQEAGPTKGRVALFATCYGNYNEPDTGEDLVAVFQHNGIPVTIAPKEKCCGMPKLELGDLKAVEAAKNVNIPVLSRMVDEGWDIVAPVPSCVLMFKQELPLMFPDDPDVAKVANAMYDPFEYLMLRHKHAKLNTDFTQPLGKVSYHVACHQRVQNIGMKTREVLQLIPGTEVAAIERCSGHDGTYGVRKDTYDIAVKLVRPVVRQSNEAQADHYTSDCVMAGHHIAAVAGDDRTSVHPITLVRKAYGI
jgi:Fe-S oxidoreductase